MAQAIAALGRPEFGGYVSAAEAHTQALKRMSQMDEAIAHPSGKGKFFDHRHDPSYSWRRGSSS